MDDKKATPLSILATVFIVCAIGFQHCTLRAQRTDVALWQTRSCVGETMWAKDECTAMIYVHRKRAQARGWSMLRMIRTYSSPVRFDRPRSVQSIRRSGEPVLASVAAGGRIRPIDPEARGRRRWIRLLKPRGEAPSGWPERLPWRRYRTRFADLYVHVRAVLRGGIPDPCPDAIHYGSARLDGVPRGHEVDPKCLPLSESAQRFYRPIQRGDSS